MRTPLRRRNLLALVVIAAFTLMVAPSASAVAISTVVQVGETAGSISPSTVNGAAGDTLQVHNAGTHAGSFGYYITIENGTGTASLGGYPCTNSGICMITDGSTETLTILTPGTFWIVREYFGGSTTIGTLTVTNYAPPSPPTGVTATAGNARATVAWTAPASDGGLAISTYTATAVPGGAHCTAAPPATSCVISGLTNGTTYTVWVTSTNAFATSSASDNSATVTPVRPDCASSKWNFGVVDYDATGYGDQILVQWNRPTICSGSLTSFALYQATSATGPEIAVDPTLCTPSLSGTAPGTTTLWSCSLKVAQVPANTLWFRVVGTTDDGLLPTSRQVKWVRGQTPDADVVAFGTGACGGGGHGSGGSGSLNLGATGNAYLVCFLVSLVLQTEYASNGNAAITDKQAREILNIGIAFSDSQTARRDRAAKAKWVSIGKKTVKIKKAGKLSVSLPISKRGRAMLAKGPLKVRVTYTLTRGTATRQIVRFVTLARIAS